MTKQDIAMITNSIGDLKLAEEVENVLLAHLEEKEMKENLNKEVQSAMFNLLYSFPGSRLLTDRDPVEFLVHERSNTYFVLGNCKTKQDVDCKVLEYVSRAAYKTEPYQKCNLNKAFHQRMLNGINTYLATNFTSEDIETVYTYLGNGCNHEKTVEFVQSGFDMSVLNKKYEKMPDEIETNIGKNTRINYLYRDACNYKQHNEEIVAGTFTKEQIDTIMDCLDSGEYFIPFQVGFSEVRFGAITEDDTCWFELSEDGFEETEDAPTTNMTPEEVVNQFLAAEGNWDEYDMRVEAEEIDEEQQQD